MPEWESFTSSEGGKAVSEATPAPSPTMEADEYAVKQGTEVAEVSIARVGNVLEGDGLPHRSSESIVVTQLGDMRLQIHREPVDTPRLQIETRTKPEDGGHAELSLQAIANHWDTEHLQLIVIPIEDEDRWVLVAASRLFMDESLSDRQIHAILRRGFIVGLSAAQELPSLLAGSVQ